MNDSFYGRIGAQNITSHVNFSALSHWGAKSDLRETGFTSQGYFLISLGFREHLIKSLEGESDIVKAAQKAATISNTLLMDMGNKYKVLIQEKGVRKNKLSGLACYPSDLG